MNGEVPMIAIAAKGEVVAEMEIDVTHAVTEIRRNQTRHFGLPEETITVEAVAPAPVLGPPWMTDIIDPVAGAVEMKKIGIETEAHVGIGMAAENGRPAPNAPRANLRHLNRRKMSVIVGRCLCSSLRPD